VFVGLCCSPLSGFAILALESEEDVESISTILKAAVVFEETLDVQFLPSIEVCC
jgi:hypothetical protein